jgi:hypothetical protein
MRARGARKICVAFVASTRGALGTEIVKPVDSAGPPANYTGQSS